MDITRADWQRLFELLDRALELQEHERAAWVDGLDGDSARLKAPLRELLSQHARFESVDFLEPRGGAQAVNGLEELSTLLGQFVAGAINLEQLCAKFRDFLDRNPQRRYAVVTWLGQAMENGRLAAPVFRTLDSLIQQHARAQTPAGNGSPAHSAAAETELRAAEGNPAQQNTRPSAGSAETASSNLPNPAVGRDDASGVLRVGAVLAKRFTLMKELGQGGMGRVFKAHDAHAEDAHDRDTYVAVKVISEEFKRFPDAFQALQREVKRARTLTHENVIKVYDTHRDGPHDFLSMEFLEGRPLDALLKTDFAAGLRLEKARSIIVGIGRALEYGHGKNIVHSDLKPANVFICNDGRVKVLDFGIARPMPPPGGEGEGTRFDPALRIGALTPAYAALEQWNRENPDPRDDIYPLAIVTYELLSGRHPFDGKSAPNALAANLVPQKISSLSRPQWEALRKALAFRRKERSESVTEFLHAFAPKSFLRRHNVAVGLCALAVAGGSATLGTHLYNRYEEQRAVSMGAPDLPPPRTDLTPQQQQEIEDSLWLARDYLKEAKVTMSPEDLEYVLSEGANSVNQILDGVRAIDPGNLAARDLKQQAANLYARKARELINARKFDRANELIQQGRKVSYTVNLYRLEQELCAKHAPACRRASSR